MKKLLAVTACPTGITHTYMSAEALQKAAKAKNVELKVETRGTVGIENALTEEEIAEAHASPIISPGPKKSLPCKTGSFFVCGRVGRFVFESRLLNCISCNKMFGSHKIMNVRILHPVNFTDTGVYLCLWKYALPIQHNML